jgi:4-aminobutyrate aminotransferase-like enzyme
MPKVKAKEKLFRTNLVHPDILDITGHGLMLGLQLESAERVQLVIAHMLAKGVITDWFLFATDKIRIAPPLIISESEILKVCKLLKIALDSTKGAS